ncbi:MAG TPA: STAS domain-containing protein [Rhodocyclaceae bacterium]|nr:STAS domain-containing protein [Rhodocyclaceae bacterium]HMV53337.1 STAS domain-containing protein [Rhodocyclaceae bacterium]HMZ83012.1 STAS domain-containing protein [Rhodocyclaceae bacterium]HNA03136.1 STAS domain-containing protein [Rhodocyclaceae bacterium]HNB78446.1 STAS domain-containing protein [Rhodocyclaceae bacterium]
MSDAAIRESGGRLAVTGSLTIPQAARLLEEGARFVSARDALFDLAAVEQVDSSGVAVILGWMRAAQAAGHKVSVANAPGSLRSIAQLYGVDDILPLV